MPTPNEQSADEVLIRSLGHGKTVAEAAQMAQVSERTVFRRLKDPAFKSRVTDVRSAAVSSDCGMPTSEITDDSYKLNQLIWNQNPHVGFKAAKAVIDLTLKVREQVDVGDQLNRLERMSAGHYPDDPATDPHEDELDAGPGSGIDGGGPPVGGPDPEQPHDCSPQEERSLKVSSSPAVAGGPRGTRAEGIWTTGQRPSSLAPVPQGSVVELRADQLGEVQAPAPPGPARITDRTPDPGPVAEKQVRGLPNPAKHCHGQVTDDGHAGERPRRPRSQARSLPNPAKHCHWILVPAAGTPNTSREDQAPWAIPATHAPRGSMSEKTLQGLPNPAKHCHPARTRARQTAGKMTAFTGETFHSCGTAILSAGWTCPGFRWCGSTHTPVRSLPVSAGEDA
ncbi:MAG: hypothetical protein JWO38_4950 [Gemmataceae bacterium]|nr:hypothetical protein [Gemmataceae bacterium]